ncbi:MAG: tyrosine-type recombinase/integrase [Promethearchaeota archaeon]
MDKLLTVKEVAKTFNFHPQTIYKWKDEGRIAFIKINGRIRFKKEDIEAWQNINKYETPITSEFVPKFMISLRKFDRMLLKGRSALSNKNSGRWNYGFGTVYIRRTKQGKIRYCIDYRGRDGNRKREVVKNAQSRADAVLALQKKVSEIFDTEYSPGRTKKINFKEFSKLYLENYSKLNKKSWMCDYYSLDAHLIPYFGEFKLCEITPLLIEKYRAERLSTGVRKSSTNREMALLKKMFNLAIDWQYAKDNPVRKVRFFPEKNNLKERVLSEEEESRLLEESANHLKPIIIAALNTGMRKNEILTLTWGQVDLKLRLIRVVKTKSGKDRVIPVNDMLLEVFKELKAKRSGNFVFANPKTGLPFRKVRQSFESACRRANIHAFRFHDLRHTFSCRMIQKGCDIETLRDLLGHHSITVTQRYIHTNLDWKKQAVELLIAKKAEKEPVLSRICHADRDEKDGSAITSLFSVN